MKTKDGVTFRLDLPAAYAALQVLEVALSESDKAALERGGAVEVGTDFASWSVEVTAAMQAADHVEVSGI